MSPGPIRVLLIEDSALARQMVGALLASAESTTFQVDMAECLSEGIERIARGDLDVILLDLTLPDSRGLETLGAVRAKAPSLPIVVSTGTDDMAIAVAAVKQGAQDYLVKDRMDSATLTRVVRYAIERKRLESAKDELLHIIAHEIRNPLVAITDGIAQVLEGTLGPTTTEQQEMLSIALQAAKRLTRLTTELLDMSKLEAGKVQLMPARVDLVRLVNEVAATFAARAKAKGLIIRTVCPTPPLELLADADKITRVFSNLVSNAVKFTAHGSVELSLIDREAVVECCVSDTGPGIAEQDLARVFGKFQQLESVTSDEQGTGLGLAICQALVELHQGSIRVESTVGQGTRFVFTLPKTLRVP